LASDDSVVASGFTIDQIATTVNAYLTDKTTDLGQYVFYIEGQLGTYNSAQSADFTINIADPCLNTVLQSQTIADKFATVLQNDPQETEIFTTFQDSVSLTKLPEGTGYDICGERTYSIEGPNADVSYLQVTKIDADNVQLKLQTDDSAYIQTNEVHNLVVSLAEYSEVTAIKVPFEVTIGACEVTSIHPGTQITLQTYFVTDAELSIPVTGYATDPACGYEILYEGLTDEDTSAFFSFDTETQSFKVQSQDHSILGTYVVTVRAYLADSDVENQDMTFTLQIDSCWEDTVTLITPLPDFFYNIGSGKIDKETDFI
jgi:hypothetical protein